MSKQQLHVTPLSYTTRRRPRRRWLRFTLILLTLVVLLVPALSGYVAWSLTHPAKKPLKARPESLGLAYQDVQFASSDGTTLRGWLLAAQSADANTPPNNDRLVVMAHGYAGNRVQDPPALPMAQALTQSGFAVLMFDFRNSGESDGAMTTVGLYEKDDLLSAMHFAELQGYGKQGIGLLGYSMGAATSLITAADAPEVQALVVDSPFSDLTDYLKENMPSWSHLPSFPFTTLMLAEMPLLTDGHHASEVSPLQAVQKLKDHPIFFIHGGHDNLIPMKHSEKILATLANPGDELWTVPAAGHVGTYEQAPEPYKQKVVTFFQQHLGKTGNGTL